MKTAENGGLLGPGRKHTRLSPNNEQKNKPLATWKIGR